MPVSPSDIRHYRAQLHPADDTSPVGGAVTPVEITGALSGEVIPDGSLVIGVSEQIVYYKTFVKNTHNTDTLLGAGVYVPNALPDTLPGTGPIRLAATAADAGKVVRLHGLVGGAPATEQVTLASTPVDSVNSFSELWRAELAGGLTASADIQIRYAPTDEILGHIPAGSRSATAEVDIAVEAAPGGNTTSVDRRTAPPGLTFSRPSDSGGALSMGDIGPGVAWAIWRRYRFRTGALPPLLPGLEVVLRVIGTTV